MQLTQAQKTLLKTHMNANTNTVLNVLTQQQAAINTLLGGPPFNLDNLQNVANWYNGTALAGDNQPFSNLLIWNTNVTIAQLNSAILWQTPPVGADQPTVSNSWLLWQTMLWNMQIDMSDAQVRKGVLQVWGNVASPSSAANIGAVGCGQLNGRRIELVFCPGPVGAVTAWAAAAKCPTGLNGTAILGQPIAASDIEDALLFG